ncbi:GNAT family N-acetyltransferase [Levilactobacillus angrenensis]|uniref:GNAT family N-acetyltransferase n=1 Tax=Levilactobacillus angrenensis TaxID=2486020 RepID=A0ABW1U8L3_9LACO|nr:GNAT family protein [Levilactobacillus angrenensis]
MLLRQAQMNDLPQILKMVGDGRRFLAAQGIDQWQGNYPQTATLVANIQHQHTYVLVQANQILGAAAVVPGIDRTYQQIMTGQWLTDGSDYLAIHRVMVSTEHHGEGVAENLIREILAETDKLTSYASVRIDTHPQNKAMQHIIMKCGFTAIGTVNLTAIGKPHTNNFAYERLNANVPAKRFKGSLVD